jgi:RNA polymerase sigma factor (sigma-70 family)
LHRLGINNKIITTEYYQNYNSLCEEFLDSYPTYLPYCMSMKETGGLLPDDLQQIIHGCIHGNRSAQAQLYNLYSQKMMGICMWYAKNREGAEEILQDGFVRVLLHIHTYKGEGSLEGWIRRIIVNTALIKFRSQKSNTLRIIEYKADAHDNAEYALFVYHFDEKELLKLIQSLSPIYRMVFNLFVMEGMKHKEIAELLGISEGTSKSNLADARAVLKKKIMQMENVAAHKYKRL